MRRLVGGRRRAPSSTCSGCPTERGALAAALLSARAVLRQRAPALTPRRRGLQVLSWLASGSWLGRSPGEVAALEGP
eukprot:4092270-Alexandrium_andersonii.AAC.1